MSDKGGRPQKYKPEYVNQVRKLCELGATDAEIADFFNVTPSTIQNWGYRYPKFLEAKKRARAVADDRVEDRLYNRAMGYTYEATKVFLPAGTSEPVYATYPQHVPPDPVSMIFWLKNRRPDIWRDRKDVEYSGTVNLDAPASEVFERLKARAEAAGITLLPPPDLELEAEEIEEPSTR